MAWDKTHENDRLVAAIIRSTRHVRSASRARSTPRSDRALAGGFTAVFATPAAVAGVTPPTRKKTILVTERIDLESQEPLRQVLSSADGARRRERAAAR